MQYECTYILAPDLNDAGVKERVDKVDATIKSHGGTIAYSDNWGRRRMAYEINKNREGQYFHLRFEGGPDTLSELNRILRLDDQVLRHLVIRDESKGASKRTLVDSTDRRKSFSGPAGPRPQSAPPPKPERTPVTAEAESAPEKSAEAPEAGSGAETSEGGQE